MSSGILLLNEKDVARALKISLPTIRRWRATNYGPRFIRLGSSVRYRECDLEAFINGVTDESSPAPRMAA
jgi:predicted DNA-binding transcriptional regulator AlpA